MASFYQVMEGILNRGFQGHILYSILIPEDVRTLQFTLRFEKREWEGDQDILYERCRKALLLNLPDKLITPETIQNAMNHVKGEMNLSVRYNGQEIGGMHRNLLLKKAVVGPEKASEGFQPVRFRGGILQLDLHCLHVTNDRTRYILEIGEEKVNKGVL